jgi:hypothetical protein
MYGSTAISSEILETPEDNQCWPKHAVTYTSEVEEILTFKTSEGFKKQGIN